MKHDSANIPRLEKQDFDKEGLIVLSKGEIADDTRYWAYVHIPFDNLEDYCDAHAKGSFSLQDYGTIICWGPTDEPPEGIVSQMQELYEIRDDFSEYVLEELGKTRAGADIIDRVKKHIDSLTP